MAPSFSRHEQYEMLGQSGISSTLCPEETSLPFSNQTLATHDNASSTTLQDAVVGKNGASMTSKPSRWRRIGNNFWLQELASWLLGLASLAAIIGVLVRFDGRSVPSLAFGITLGALVSLLSTIATIFLAAPLAAGIGQARWIWFRKQRTLADFELITDAARSPFSALELILRRKGGLTTFGAFFAIVVLAVNPFVQQVIKYDTRYFNRTTATIPIATGYDIHPLEDIIALDPGLQMKAAIFRGLFQIDVNNSAFDVNPRCPTGNCTWPRYGTLSVCGRCADLTQQLSLVSSTNVTGEKRTSLPNGLSLTWPTNLSDQGFKTMTINNTLLNAGLDSIAFRNVNYSITNMFAILGQWGKTNGPYASECILQFCAQNMTALSTNGSFAETAVSKPLYLDRMYNGSVYAVDGGMNWTVEYETWNGLNMYFGRLFNSFVQQSNSASPMPQWSNDISQAVFYYLNSTSHTLDGMFNDLSSSMGTYIRGYSQDTFSGYATAHESFVEVRWPWMILPLIVVAAVLIFVIASMIVTRNTGLEPWKESSIAVLFHGLDGHSRATLFEVRKKWEMDNLAGRSNMRLERNNEGIYLNASAK